MAMATSREMGGYISIEVWSGASFNPVASNNHTNQEVR